LGLTLWQRSFEVVNTEWLRWCDREGQVLPTGEEKAALEQQRAEAERQRAEALLELLRSHGKGLRPANAKG
ncbi:Uma2 family endonuclease, partial [Synechococcus sp. R3-13]